MTSTKEIMKNISETVDDIADTASDVNRYSHGRKELTSNGLSMINDLFLGNESLKTGFDRIYQNLNDSLSGIAANSEELRGNIYSFSGIKSNIAEIKNILNSLNNEILKMTGITAEIENDTDEIFTLALNASIVSSKYSGTSGVFDILANKLNEMSGFISNNLEGITRVIKPVTEGVEKLIHDNMRILQGIEEGQKSFLEFPGILDRQKDSINELVLNAYDSGTRIEDQKKMLDEIKSKVDLMDQDSDAAIFGSANVRDLAENLKSEIGHTASLMDAGKDFTEKIELVREKSVIIWKSAANVNEKSRNQLDFSLSCVDFCDSLIEESGKLRETTKDFNSQSFDNSRMADSISERLEELTSGLKSIEEKISESSNMIYRFNEDYSQINSILEFLKNILKSMNVIGMYSRIESSRNPDEFSGFITISEDIGRLQSRIQDNLPKIEDNITFTQNYIEDVNSHFEEIRSIFLEISRSSSVIIKKLGAITGISTDSKDISQTILEESEKNDIILFELKSSLMHLTEVVKKPIEGSALNIERGKNIELQCSEMKNFFEK